MQREVALRLTALPRTKDYGILSVQTQSYWSRPEYLFTVSRNVFHPGPNVESALYDLALTRPIPALTASRLKLVVRTAFSQRRKKP